MDTRHNGNDSPKNKGPVGGSGRKWPQSKPANSKMVVTAQVVDNTFGGFFTPQQLEELALLMPQL